MKLYLSSFRLGDHPERLVALLPASGRVAVICNAIDAEDPALRREKVAAEIEWLTELGLRPVEVDLRSYSAGGARGDSDLRAGLTQYDGLWVRGGNVFVLRVALARSGADKFLPDLIRSGELVYAGYSAGPCVLAPSLRGLELCDDVTQVEGEVIWEGLGVLDEAIVPHLNSPGHPETELVEKIAELYERTGVRHLKLRDGQALVVAGESREVV
ncbi:Type 1 glutamine amidotransferase-like domain-containing protein [Kribbella sp. VKM Ac-2568]|uniref:Type 1 glutamine amidotransferase-like domain-containing protein n=1 Tax=Kribbella sp. VKM Ac-2568 TaxID=2512219 RepID=UPI00104CB475|nr:Type 1 glutamine amidotransferase-like domain-containing protein [Kribbella sp. VKM Ac-2568]TCM50358.1 dipeptidase E [Kribbella sp. VKM Ac-2568]